MLKLSEKAETRLIRARVELFRNFPFFGELAKFVRPILTKHVTETACVNPNFQMYLNVDFAEKATAKDFVFILVHETMHIVNGTIDRFPVGGDRMLWNYAGDIAINDLIVNHMNIDLPEKSLIEPLFYGFEEYWGKTHEEIYELLKQSEKQMPYGFWADPSSCESCEGQFEQNSIAAQEWKERIKQAAETAKAVGKLPGNLEIFIASLRKAKNNWRRVLALITAPNLRARYSWRVPSRRTRAIDIITPSPIEQKPEVCVYLDTSGSMNDASLNEALSEIAMILKMAQITLILSDTEVYYVGKVDLQQISKLPVKRGGTDFNPVFEVIRIRKLQPKIFVGFSDLQGPFPEVTPNFPIIWCRASGSNSPAPWGQIIQM